MGFGKCIFSTFHYIFLVLSLILMGIGLYLYFENGAKLAQYIFPNSKLTDGEETEKNFEKLFQLFKTLGGIIIGCGAFLFFMSIVGYCGAMQKSRMLLALYAFLISVLLIAQIGIIGYIGVEGTTEVKNILKELPKKFYDVKANGSYVHTGFTEEFNKIMKDEKCCGIVDYKDFPLLNEKDPNSKRLQLPECCEFFSETCADTPFTPDNTNPGCFDHIYKDQKSIIFAILGATGFIQLVALILAIGVFRDSRDGKDEDWN